MDNKSNYRPENFLIDLKTDFYKKKKGYFISNMYFELSLYFHDLNKYFNTFPRDQILIIDYEELKNNPQITLQKICNYIEIDYSKINFDIKKKYNRSVVPIFNSRKLKYFISLLGFRNYKLLKLFFAKEIKKPNLDNETIKFINSVLGNDYKKTKDLIKIFLSD